MRWRDTLLLCRSSTLSCPTTPTYTTYLSFVLLYSLQLPPSHSPSVSQSRNASLLTPNRTSRPRRATLRGHPTVNVAPSRFPDLDTHTLLGLHLLKDRFFGPALFPAFFEHLKVPSLQSTEEIQSSQFRRPRACPHTQPTSLRRFFLLAHLTMHLKAATLHPRTSYHTTSIHQKYTGTAHSGLEAPKDADATSCQRRSSSSSGTRARRTKEQLPFHTCTHTN